MKHDQHVHHTHHVPKKSEHKPPHKHDNHTHHVDEHAGHSTEDFRKRFWICLIITIPVLLLDPMIQDLIGLGDSVRFRGDKYLLFAFASFVYFYGGFPFLQGLTREIRNKQLGMMTLIALAISVAFFLTIIALSAGFITLITWMLIGNTFDFAIERMVTVMVIACPHALGLAVPLVVAVSTILVAFNAQLLWKLKNRLKLQ